MHPYHHPTDSSFADRLPLRRRLRLARLTGGLGATGLVLCALAGAAPIEQHIADPAGIEPSDWAGIRAAHRRASHVPPRMDGGPSARNAAQRWTTRFDGRGFLALPGRGAWTGGLELARGNWAGAEVDAAGSAEAIVQSAYLKASNTNAGDVFGWAVAVSGNTVVVGAPREDSAATGIDGDQENDDAEDSGAAYVFVREGPNWSQQAYLKACNTGAGDEFGISVAISGDTILVGAWREDSSAVGIDGDQGNNDATNSGAVYVFARNGSVWSQQAYLKASNTDSGDQFGKSVAIVGEQVAVGAPGEDSIATGVNGDEADNSAQFAGAAYAFVRSGTVWSQDAYLKASNTHPYTVLVTPEFGWSVAVTSDMVVVGAPGENGNATGIDGDGDDIGSNASGAAYIFVNDGASWRQQAYVKASNTDPGDQFGIAVTASADTVVIGAAGENSAATGVNGDQANNSIDNAVAAYVFVRSGSTWSQQAYVKSSNTTWASGGGDAFGVSVSISGDRLAVGAMWEDSSATGIDGDDADNSLFSAGAAYLFDRSGSAWSQSAYVKASNTDKEDQFGWVVAVSDGTLVVGSATEDSAATGVNGDQASNSAVDAGAAYAYILNDCNANGVPDGEDITVGTSLDLDGDGVPDECGAACPADLSHDGKVDGADLGILLVTWDVEGPSEADLDGSGTVDGADLGLLLGAWGSCE